MREYGRIYSAFWLSADMQALSDDGRMLALYLLSGPHGTIAGAFRLPNGYVQEDLRWTDERVTKGFAELFDKAFAKRCETTKWLWIRNFLTWNPPENPNQWKAARKVAASVPDNCSWRDEFIEVFSAAAGDNPPPNSNPSGTVPKRSPTQEQQQEQEQQQNVRGARAVDPRETVESEQQIFQQVSLIKAKYPKAPREDWIAAEKHMRNLVSDAQATWEHLAQSVERYAKLVKATGRMVLNPANFFGASDRPWAQEWALPLTPEQQAKAAREQQEREGMQRLVSYAVSIDCPLKPRLHELAATFESRINDWKNHEGRRPASKGGPASIGAILARGAA